MLPRLPRISLALIAALALAPSACDDGAPSTPGTAIVTWSLPGTSTCESLGLETLEVRALTALEDGEVVASGTGVCPGTESDGTLTLTDVPPGRYFIGVEGFATDGRGTHLGISEERARIPDGATVDLADEQGLEVGLKVKPVNLIVDWSLGQRCSQAGIDTVEVSLRKGNGDLIADVDTISAGCDHTVEHPETDEMVPGVLFEDLPALADPVRAFVEARDSDGGTVREGASAEPFQLLPGDVKTEVVDLTSD